MSFCVIEGPASHRAVTATVRPRLLDLAVGHAGDVGFSDYKRDVEPASEQFQNPDGAAPRSPVKWPGLTGGPSQAVQLHAQAESRARAAVGANQTRRPDPVRLGYFQGLNPSMCSTLQ